jgi:hypothetical protein
MRGTKLFSAAELFNGAGLKTLQSTQNAPPKRTNARKGKQGKDATKHCHNFEATATRQGKRKEGLLLSSKL